jgi:Na+(H+)/acetate symporter ActP
VPDDGNGRDAACADALLHHHFCVAGTRSVAWSLLFIMLLYMAAPILAVLVKYEVLNSLVGSPIDHTTPVGQSLVAARPGAVERA